MSLLKNYNKYYNHNFSKINTIILSILNPSKLLIANIINTSYYYRYNEKDYIDKIIYSGSLTLLEIMIYSLLNLSNYKNIEDLKKNNDMLLVRFIIILLTVQLIFQYDKDTIFKNNKFKFRLLGSIISVAIYLFIHYFFIIFAKIYNYFKLNRKKISGDMKELLTDFRENDINFLTHNNVINLLKNN